LLALALLHRLAFARLPPRRSGQKLQGALFHSLLRLCASSGGITLQGVFSRGIARLAACGCHGLQQAGGAGGLRRLLILALLSLLACLFALALRFALGLLAGSATGTALGSCLQLRLACVLLADQFLPGL